MRNLIFIVLVVLLMLPGCGMELKPSPEKVYKEETKKMTLIKAHQILQLEVMRINAAIAQMNTKAEKNMPTFNLTPAKPTETPAEIEARIRAKIKAEAIAKAKAEALSRMNKIE